MISQLKTFGLLLSLLFFTIPIYAQRIIQGDVVKAKAAIYLDEVRIDSISDDATFSDASSSKLATTDAIKSYVDALINAEVPTLNEVLAAGNTSNLGLSISNLSVTGAGYNQTNAKASTHLDSYNALTFGSTGSGTFGGFGAGFNDYNTSGLNYRSWFSYGIGWDEINRRYVAGRSTLGRKWLLEMSHHKGFKLRYADAAQTDYIDTDFVNRFVINPTGQVYFPSVASGYAKIVTGGELVTSTTIPSTDITGNLDVSRIDNLPEFANIVTNTVIPVSDGTNYINSPLIVGSDRLILDNNHLFISNDFDVRFEDNIGANRRFISLNSANIFQLGNSNNRTDFAGSEFNFEGLTGKFAGFIGEQLTSFNNIDMNDIVGNLDASRIDNLVLGDTSFLDLYLDRIVTKGGRALGNTIISGTGFTDPGLTIFNGTGVNSWLAFKSSLGSPTADVSVKRYYDVLSLNNNAPTGKIEINGRRVENGGRIENGEYDAGTLAATEVSFTIPQTDFLNSSIVKVVAATGGTTIHKFGSDTNFFPDAGTRMLICNDSETDPVNLLDENTSTNSGLGEEFNRDVTIPAETCKAFIFRGGLWGPIE